jgi:hypothetical protein
MAGWLVARHDYDFIGEVVELLELLKLPATTSVAPFDSGCTEFE